MGANSTKSSQQQVTLLHGAEAKQDVEIMSADEVSPAVWSIKLFPCNDGKCPPSEDLMAQPSSLGKPDPSSWRRVVFTDYGVAIRLAQWLRTHPTEARHTEIGSIRFNFPFNSKDNLNSSLRPSKCKKDECKEESPTEVSSIPEQGTPSAESTIRRYSKHVTSARRLDAKPREISRQ